MIDLGNWLLNFGYVDHDGVIDPDELTVAVKAVQRHYGLPETGEPDQAFMRTIEMSRRCGVPDVGAMGSGVRKWGISRLSWNVESYLSDQFLSKSDVDRLLDLVFRQVSSVCGLVFHRNESSRVNIKFQTGRGRRAGFDGPSGTLAFARFPATGGFTGQVETVFDDDEHWTAVTDPARAMNRIMFFNVALHEVGHNLGLVHDTVSGQVMNATYNAALSEWQHNDRRRLVNLYGMPHVPHPQPKPVAEAPELSRLELMLRLNGQSTRGPYDLDLTKIPTARQEFAEA